MTSPGPFSNVRRTALTCAPRGGVGVFLEQIGDVDEQLVVEGGVGDVGEDGGDDPGGHAVAHPGGAVLEDDPGGVLAEGQVAGDVVAESEVADGAAGDQAEDAEHLEQGPDVLGGGAGGAASAAGAGSPRCPLGLIGSDAFFLASLAMLMGELSDVGGRDKAGPRGTLRYPALTF